MNKAIFLLFIFLGACTKLDEGIERRDPLIAHYPALIEEEHDLDATDFPQIRLEVYLQPDKLIYSVQQEISYVNRSPNTVHELYFRTLMQSYGGRLTLSAAKVDEKDVQVHFEDAGGFFSIRLLEPLVPKAKSEIEFDFSATIGGKAPKNSRLFAYHDNCLMFDYFYPSIMVNGPGGIDLSPPLSYGDLVYNEAALFTVELTYPTDFLYASSGVRTGSELVDSEYKKDLIVTGPARSFFLAGGFGWTKQTAQHGHTVINILGAAGNTELLNKAAPYALEALEIMSSILLPYPYAELDVVFIPAGWSAMEFSGIIAMGENYLPGFSAAAKKLSFRNSELILVHEMMHQWFFNYVGNDQLREPWLDEAFVQYMGRYYFSKKNGRKREQEYMTFLNNIAKESITGPAAIDQTVYEYSNGGEYTKVVYGKAALRIAEFADFTGRERFLEFIAWYLRKNRWHIVSTTRFFKQLEDFFGEEPAAHFRL